MIVLVFVLVVVLVVVFVCHGSSAAAASRLRRSGIGPPLGSFTNREEVATARILFVRHRTGFVGGDDAQRNEQPIDICSSCRHSCAGTHRARHGSAIAA
jgi:hypothetical protein